MTEPGVLIDFCPTGKGVWLDRGELDKILTRACEVERNWEEEYRQPAPRRGDPDDDAYEDHRYAVR